MENIFVEFLPPWVETGLQPAFYDKESGTVLQQTARMYDRVNMLVRMFNKLSKNTKTVVEDYIEKFNELHDYVHDYFDNLDVQEEINNKLEQMYEDGQLADIIAGYIQLRGILSYDTVNDMKNATNLVNGSFAETYGFYSKGDGGGAKYKIREITNDDTIDDMFLFSIDGDPSNTLVAELINSESMNVLQFGVKNDGVTDVTSKLQTLIDDGIALYLKDGTYLVEGQLTGDITIKGESQNSVIDGGQTKHDVIDVSDSATTNKVYLSNISFSNSTIKLYDTTTYGSVADTKNIYAENVWFDEPVPGDGSTFWGMYIKSPKPADYTRYGNSGYACYPLEITNNSGYNALMIENVCTDDQGVAQSVSDNSAIGIIDKVSSSSPAILLDMKYSRDMLRMLNANATYKQDASVFEVNSQGHLAIGCRVAPDASLTGYATLKLNDEVPSIMFYNHNQNQTPNNNASIQYAGDKPDKGFRYYIQGTEIARLSIRGMIARKAGFSTIQGWPKSDLIEGEQVWDETNHRPLWFNGTSWITGDGTSVYTPA